MKKIYLLLIAIFTINIANAQWQQTSITGSAIWSFAISGDTIFEGSIGSVGFSIDNGNSWTGGLGAGLPGTYVTSLAISGKNVFAGTNNNYGVYLNTENGSNWTAVNTGLTSYALNILSLAIKGSSIFAGTEQGLYLSTNNGSNWSLLNTGIPTSESVQTFAIKDSNIFAGTNGGVYLSTNNGSSWSQLNTGLTNTDVLSLAISGNYIYAGTEGGKMFISSNNGSSWTLINNGLPTSFFIRALVISGNNIFAGDYNGAGVYLSTNNGASWSELNTGLGNTEVEALVISGGNIFAGTNYGGVWELQFIDTVTTSANPTIGGTTSGGGTFTLNQTCIVKATPLTGYTFVNWTESGDTVSTDTSYTFTVTANRNLVANFTQSSTQYTITTSANPTNGGTASGGGTFTLNQSCTVKATPLTGYTFVNWTENSNIVSVDTSYTFNITTNRNLVANFMLITTQDTISTSANPAIGGTTTGGGTFSLNQSCTVKATPLTGYYFVNWTENSNIVSTDTTYTFNVTSNRNLVANFAQNATQYTITTSTNPTNGGTASGGGTFTLNQSCTVKATALTGYIFVDWTENTNIVSTDTNYTFNVTANRSLVANFFSTQGIEVNSIQKSAFLYPNPAKEKTTLTYSQLNANGQIQIYNILGQIVFEENLTNGSSQLKLNTQKYKAGLYKVILRENGIIKGQVSLVKE